MGQWNIKMAPIAAHLNAGVILVVTEALGIVPLPPPPTTPSLNLPGSPGISVPASRLPLKRHFGFGTSLANGWICHACPSHPASLFFSPPATRSVLNTAKLWSPTVWNPGRLTPSLPQPVKCPGWKVQTYIYSIRQYIWGSYNKSTFNTVHLDMNPFARTCERANKP